LTNSLKSFVIPLIGLYYASKYLSYFLFLTISGSFVLILLIGFLSASRYIISYSDAAVIGLIGRSSN